MTGRPSESCAVLRSLSRQQYAGRIVETGNSGNAVCLARPSLVLSNQMHVKTDVVVLLAYAIIAGQLHERFVCRPPPSNVIIKPRPLHLVDNPHKTQGESTSSRYSPLNRALGLVV